MDKRNERETAALALLEITNGGYNNIVLKRVLDKSPLEPGQRAFVTEVTNGALRNLIYIDYIINKVSSIPTGRMKPLILSVLRTAVYEILFLSGAPDYAVCSEAVNIVKRAGLSGLSGFVNAVLRNILRKKDSIVFPDKTQNFNEWLSITYSCPEWIVSEFIQNFGPQETEAMLKTNNQPPKLTLCVNALKTTTEELTVILENESLKCAPSRVKGAIHASGVSDITKLPSFVNGLFHVMDASSMLAVKALAPQKGHKIIDLCAAPGGKSFLAAYLTENTGEILSLDIHPHKLELIRSGSKRLGISNLVSEVSDTTEFNEKFAGAFDRVIADLPCSGFGTIRKKPDIKYTKKPQNVTELAALQRSILKNAARYLKPGGILVYSTCTLTKAENQDNADWLAECGLEKCDLSPIAKEYGLPVAENTITILPHYMDSDGFFFAKFRRVSM